jgi:hypothetical protein
MHSIEAPERLTSTKEALASAVRSYLNDLAIAAALGIRMADFEARLRGIEARAERKQLLVAFAMERAGIKTIVEPDFTASISKSGESDPTSLLVRTR